MAFLHSFFIVANNVSGAEKRFFNAFSASENSLLVINERLFQLYVENNHLSPASPAADRVVILKEGSLMKFLYKKLYVAKRLRLLYIFLQRVAVLLSLYANRKKIREITDIHAVLDGVRYLPVIKRVHPNIKCFASVVDPTLEFNQHKARLFGLKNCDHIDSLNINIRNELIRLGYDENRLSITPNSFTNYDKIKPQTKERIITFCARLIKPKNPQVFVDIADHFAKKNPDTSIRFVLIGDGPLKADIDKRIEGSNHLKNIIETTGYIASPTEIFAKSLVFVQLSDTEIHGTQSMLEAMGSCCYIMVSYLDGIENVVKHDFGDILKLDAESFSNRIKQLVDNFEETEEAGKKARTFALQNFHVNNFLQYLFTVYQNSKSITTRHSAFRTIKFVLIH